MWFLYIVLYGSECFYMFLYLFYMFYVGSVCFFVFLYMSYIVIFVFYIVSICFYMFNYVCSMRVLNCSCACLYSVCMVSRLLDMCQMSCLCVSVCLLYVSMCGLYVFLMFYMSLCVF